jgi:acyl-CoA synthetase (AMP-forming)/AMP-acid ligase II
LGNPDWEIQVGWEIQVDAMKVPLTLSDFFERAELVYGRRVGVVDEPAPPGGGLGELTWSRFGELARAQAARLDELGVGFGERVAVLSQNAARLLVSFHGVSGFGRICVPINFRLNAAEVGYILEHCDARVLLVDPSLEPLVRGTRVKHVVVLGESSDAELYRTGVQPQLWEPDEEATAVINYTSGTTARPKGVEQTHRSLWINAVTFALHTTASDRDVYLHTLPMFHCNGWGMPYALAGVGALQVVLRQVDGEEILRRIEQHGVTLLCGAPAVLARVLEAAEARGGPVPGSGRLRAVVAGAPPPSRLIERVESELGWELIQIYGLTETAPLLTINRRRAEDDALRPGERAQRLSRAGAPALGVRVRVDAQGEVLARANVVLKGYWEQPQATDEAIVDGWFHTGDGGSVDDENHVTISDRKKDVIITGGENVSSIEVEDCIFSHPAVAEVAVIGVPDERWGETVKALVVPAAGATVSERDIIEHCRARLAHFKCPTSVELRSELARTATGKLQKFKLREPYWQGRTRQVN